MKKSKQKRTTAQNEEYEVCGGYDFKFFKWIKFNLYFRLTHMDMFEHAHNIFIFVFDILFLFV